MNYCPYTRSSFFLSEHKKKMKKSMWILLILHKFERINPNRTSLYFYCFKMNKKVSLFLLLLLLSFIIFHSRSQRCKLTVIKFGNINDRYQMISMQYVKKNVRNRVIQHPNKFTSFYVKYCLTNLIYFVAPSNLKSFTGRTSTIDNKYQTKIWWKLMAYWINVSCHFPIFYFFFFVSVDFIDKHFVRLFFFCIQTYCFSLFPSFWKICI